VRRPRDADFAHAGPVAIAPEHARTRLRASGAAERARDGEEFGGGRPQAAFAVAVVGVGVTAAVASA
jgi:hypothetical protein